MAKLTWHVPNFCDGDGESVEFETVEEFYAIPEITEDQQRSAFVRWSYSDPHLMVELNDGSFWVVAKLSRGANKILNLPKWKMPLKDRAELINKQKPSRLFDPDEVVNDEGDWHYKYSKFIAEARVTGDQLELRFEDESEWVPVDSDNLHISWGR